MAQVGSLEKLYQTYKDRVEFILVYIQEAHPGSILSLPTKQGGNELQVVAQTASVAERTANLRKIVALMRLTMPGVIDDEQGTANRAYAGWPDRLYAIGVDGRVAYKGGPGPFGLKVPELADWLRNNAK